jgi:hypothetical protein
MLLRLEAVADGKVVVEVAADVDIEQFGLAAERQQLYVERLLLIGKAWMSGQ